jgi:hypothetical protein
MPGAGGMAGVSAASVPNRLETRRYQACRAVLRPSMSGICEVARSHLLGRGRMLACTTRWHAHPHEIRFIRPSRKALKSPTRLHCRQVCRGFEIWGGRSSSVQYRGRFGPLRRPLKRQPCSPFGSCAVHGGSANEAKASIRLHLSLAGHGSKVYPRPSFTPDHSSFLRRATRHRLWGAPAFTTHLAHCSLQLTACSSTPQHSLTRPASASQLNH